MRKILFDPIKKPAKSRVVSLAPEIDTELQEIARERGISPEICIKVLVAEGLICIRALREKGWCAL
jgi:hypothetical protein